MVGRASCKFHGRTVPTEYRGDTVLVEQAGKIGVVVDLDLVIPKIRMLCDIGPFEVGNRLIDGTSICGRRKQNLCLDLHREPCDGLRKSGRNA